MLETIDEILKSKDWEDEFKIKLLANEIEKLAAKTYDDEILKKAKDITAIILMRELETYKKKMQKGEEK